MRPSFSNLLLFASLWLCLSSCHYFCDCEEEPRPCQFTYDQSAYVPNDSATAEHGIHPHFVGHRPEGTFSTHPEGLAIDVHTGEIDVNNSRPGTYTVVYTLEDGATGCETKIKIRKKDENPGLTECDLRYADTLFFPNGGGTQLIRPVGDFEDSNNFLGRFSVWPQGLDIDPATGVINVDVSEPGLTYQVTFTSKDDSTVCRTTVAIAGLDYRDVILDFDATVDTDNPVVNQFLDVGTAVAPVANFDLSNSGIELFSRDDGLALANEAQVGTIDVRETLRNVNAKSGASYEFTVQYSYLPPEGESISSEVELLIYYFETVDEIPPSLLDLLSRKDRFPGTENGRLMHRHGIICGVGAL